MDPDSDLLLILLFSSAADKIPTKNKFFFFELLIDGKMLKIKNDEVSLSLAFWQILARPNQEL
jgi:hypothetical protein